MVAARRIAAVAVVLCVAGASAARDKTAMMGSGEMFDAIAPRYDLINSFLSLGMHTWWRARMVASLDLQPGMYVPIVAAAAARRCQQARGHF